MDDNLTSDSSKASNTNVLINLEAMIKSHIASISKMEEEYDESRSMLNDIFTNDPTFKAHDEAAKEASRIKSATKQQILKQPQAADLNQKVQNMRNELKDLKAALSDYLGEFQRMSGLSEIEGDDGEVREIIYVAKLVKKSAFHP